jgi:DNA-binding SARP family transcriptional activator
VPQLQVALLGAPALRLDGDLLRFDTRKAVALVAVLAVSGRRHSREELAGLLWPESDNARARAALRRTLFTAAGVGPALLADRSGVALDPAAVDCDVVTFLACAERGGAAAAREAIALYRGDFLAGFSLRDSPEWEDWRSATNDRLRRDLDRLLGVLVAHHTQRHEFDDAIEFAQRRLALDPLHEPAHQALIQLYDWTGQRTSALRQYRTCVRTLEAELGVAPLPETTALYDAVRGHRLPAPPARPPEAAVADVASPAASPPTPAAPVSPERVFVGRSAELARLSDAWAAARSSGRSLAVVGEVGSGKSALLETFARQLRGEDVAVVTVRGHEGEQTLAFAAATDLIRAALPSDPAASSSLADADRAALSRLLPAPEGADAHDGLPLDTPGARTRLFDAVRNALAALARGSASPALVVVDDVHWFDEESRDLVAFLIRRPPDHVLLVPTWRGSTTPATVAAAVADAMREGTGDMVWLPGLSREEVVDLLAGFAVAAPEAVADDVLLRTGGLPMLVVEHALAGVASGPGEITRPRVEGLVRARIDGAPEMTGQILAAIAAVAAPVDPDLLRSVSGRTDAEVVGALEDAVARGLLVEAPERAAYDFPHDTLRHVVTERTSLARRRLLHSRTADVLMQRLAPRGSSLGATAATAATVARQLDLAGRVAEAAMWHWVAADDARALYAHATAAEHLEVALALGHDPVVTHVALGDVRLRLGDYRAAIDSYEQAAALVDSDELAAEVEHKLAEVHHRLGDWDLTQTHLESALLLVPDLGVASQRRSQVLADLALVAMHRGDVAVARERAAGAAELAATVGEPSALAQAYNVLGVLDARHGDVAAARRHLATSLEHAQALLDPAPVVAALNNTARLEADAGELDAALLAAQRALELGTRHGDRHRMAALHANFADLLHRAGRDDEARAHQRESAVLFAEVDRDEVRRPEVWKLVEW